MIKILNRIFLFLKNILLPILLIATIYIVLFMFKRLGKEPFGSNFLELLGIIVPFILLFILNILNIILKNDSVKNNLFYNITSIIALITIFVFCYRALFDQNMYFWHSYSYKINFNYFADQIAAIKVMLYSLSFANILLIIDEKISPDNDKKKK